MFEKFLRSKQEYIIVKILIKIFHINFYLTFIYYELTLKL